MEIAFKISTILFSMMRCINNGNEQVEIFQNEIKGNIPFFNDYINNSHKLINNNMNPKENEKEKEKEDKKIN